jgi:hypothetical protein
VGAVGAASVAAPVAVAAPIAVAETVRVTELVPVAVAVPLAVLWTVRVVDAVPLEVAAPRAVGVAPVAVPWAAPEAVAAPAAEAKTVRVAEAAPEVLAVPVAVAEIETVALAVPAAVAAPAPVAVTVRVALAVAEEVAAPVAVASTTRVAVDVPELVAVPSAVPVTISAGTDRERTMMTLRGCPRPRRAIGYQVAARCTAAVGTMILGRTGTSGAALTSQAMLPHSVAPDESVIVGVVSSPSFHWQACDSTVPVLAVMLSSLSSVCSGVYVRDAVAFAQPTWNRALLVASPNDASVAVTVVEVVPFAVADWTSAPDPFVPPVSTPVNWTTSHIAPSWVLPAKLKVTAPDDGEAPIARNNVVSDKSKVNTFSQPMVPTCTHVRPLPLAVGTGASSKSTSIMDTAANISALPVGAMLAVAYDDASVALLPDVSNEAETAIYRRRRPRCRRHTHALNPQPTDRSSRVTASPIRSRDKTCTTPSVRSERTSNDPYRPSGTPSTVATTGTTVTSPGNDLVSAA